jgi:hypothetical protein
VRFARPNSLALRLADRPAGAATSDVAYAALPLLRKLGVTLADAGRFIAACRALEARATKRDRRWGVPPLFFFDRRARAEWEAVRPTPPEFPAPYAADVAKRLPGPAAAWTILPDVLADALTLLYGSPTVRRTARAMPTLLPRAEALAPVVPDCRDLADVLAMPEDEPILCLHPGAGVGVRVRTRGVATVHEFHTLLADAVGPDFPGARPGAAVVSAYRGVGLSFGDTPVASARFQMFTPGALAAGGTLPPRFTGSEFWLWGPEPLRVIPRVAGERVVLLGEPVFPMTWEAVRRFPFAPERVDVLDTLDAGAVAEWVRQFRGTSPLVSRYPIRKAA